jgi:ubiquinol-cytochrome c reductase cytochrome c subunit
MRLFRWGLAVVALAAAVVPGRTTAATAEKGRQLYVQHGCWQCHGYEGQGGATGPKLAPDPIPYEALSGFVRSSNRAMPPYREEILAEADLQEIYGFLQAIPPPADYRSIPLLNP